MSLPATDEPPVRGACWQELTRSECFALLAAQSVGRIAVVDDWGPVVFPVTYILDRHTLVFRTGQSSKPGIAGTGSRVAFEIDGTDAGTRTGWSVVVRGEATEVTDPAELARLRELPLHPWAPGMKSRYVRILPARLTGRRIAVPGGVPSRWFG